MLFFVFVIGWVSGLTLLFNLATLPNQAILLAMLCMVGMITFAYWFLVNKTDTEKALFKPVSAILVLILACIIGISWGVINTNILPTLTSDAFGKPVVVEVEVGGLSEVSRTLNGRPKFKLKLLVNQLAVIDRLEGFSNSRADDLFKVNAWRYDSAFAHRPKIEVSWYPNSEKSSDTDIPQLGDTWILPVKLKQNHAAMNLGAFDYEAYLFANRIQARGYVWHRAFEPFSVFSGRGHFRQGLHNHLSEQWKDSEFLGIYQALIYGEKRAISSNQWQVLQTTGTIHLMAISGLHVGILAAIGFGLFSGLWKLGVMMSLTMAIKQPKLVWGAVGGVVFATAYMALAGFSIPTQRAWFMVLSVLVFFLFRAKFDPVKSFALAALAVTLVEPRSVLMQGFWLSFGAVALIYFALFMPLMKNRLGRWKSWQIFLWIQLVLTLGLMPALAFFYHQVPIYSGVANLIAVPLVSLIALPLLMVTSVFSFLSDPLFDGLMWMNETVWQGLWFVLQDISQWPNEFIAFRLSLLEVTLIYASFLAVWFRCWLLLLPFMFALLLARGNQSMDEVSVAVLDVGQGLSVIVSVADKTLVYDTGAKWSDKVDGSSLAVIPYLRYHGKKTIDLLVISHSDNDHAGGAKRLLNHYPVIEALSGQPSLLNQQVNKPQLFKPCRANQTWQWGEVIISVLAPLEGQRARNDNDASCVIQVRYQDQALLITGDIGRKQEAKLVEVYGKSLQSNWLIAGHHGSRSSSSALFLNTVAPSHVFFSAGFKNRWHFPNREVVRRVEAMSAQYFNTACDGAIVWNWQPNPPFYRVRELKKRWFHHPCRDMDYNEQPRSSL